MCENVCLSETFDDRTNNKSFLLECDLKFFLCLENILRGSEVVCVRESERVRERD